MQSDPLVGPKIKIRRAYELVEHLHSLMTEYATGDVLDDFEEVDPQTGETLIKARMKEPIPDSAYTLVAEIAYHLRSALNQMVGVLAKAPGGRTEFPFAGSRDDFESTRTQKKIALLSPEVTSRVIALRPYKGGNDRLWGLSRLQNLDKYRGLVPVGTLGRVTGIRNMTFSGGVWTHSPLTRHPPGRLDEGMLIFKLPPGATVTGAPGEPNISISIDVTFGEVDVFKGEPVVQTMRELSLTVERIVSEFDLFCFGT